MDPVLGCGAKDLAASDGCETWIQVLAQMSCLSGEN